MAYIHMYIHTYILYRVFGVFLGVTNIVANLKYSVRVYDVKENIISDKTESRGLMFDVFCENFLSTFFVCRPPRQTISSFLHAFPFVN